MANSPDYPRPRASGRVGCWGAILFCPLSIKRGLMQMRRKGREPYLSVPLSPGVDNTCIFSKATTGELLSRGQHSGHIWMWEADTPRHLVSQICSLRWKGPLPTPRTCL